MCSKSNTEELTTCVQTPSGFIPLSSCLSRTGRHSFWRLGFKVLKTNCSSFLKLSFPETFHGYFKSIKAHPDLTDSLTSLGRFNWNKIHYFHFVYLRNVCGSWGRVTLWSINAQIKPPAIQRVPDQAVIGHKPGTGPQWGLQGKKKEKGKSSTLSWIFLFAAFPWLAPSAVLHVSRADIHRL